MATVRKTITLTDAQDDWIKAQVASGDYFNGSEYLGDLIRRDQEKVSALRAAIDEGLASGISERSLDDIRASAEARISFITAVAQGFMSVREGNILSLEEAVRTLGIALSRKEAKIVIEPDANAPRDVTLPFSEDDLLKSIDAHAAHADEAAEPSATEMGD